MTKMAAVTDLTPSLNIKDGRHPSEKKPGSSFGAEVDGAAEKSTPLKAARPPRSVIRHCASAARLDMVAERVCSVSCNHVLQLFYIISLFPFLG